MNQTRQRQKIKLTSAALLGICAMGLEQAYCEPELAPVELELDSIERVDSSWELASRAPQPSSANTALPTAAVIVPTILTTRPSFTDSWLSVPQGSFQVESGVTYTDNSNRTRNWVLPESLLKLGLTKNTELRFSVPSYINARDDDAGKIASNFGDLSLGFSHHLGLPHKLDVAFIPLLNIPTGANNLSSNSLDPQFRLVVAKTVTPKLVLASQFDTRWNTGRDALAKVIVNPTFISYYNFTNRFCGFMEYSGFYPTEGKTSQFIQGGMLYLPTKHQQWDIRVAKGLNGNSSDIVVGFGYSFRLDGLFGKSKLGYGTIQISN